MVGIADSAVKHYRTGAHRTCAPDATICRLKPILEKFGITRVANLTGLDRTGIPVVMVCRPNARSSAVFHGKGLTLVAAKASGLMEAIETWHAEHVQRPLRLASAADMALSFPLVDLDGLPRLPDSRFHADLSMLWCEADDLIGEGTLWLPFETVHANSTFPEPPGSGCFSASTNGLASGNHPLEATSHALCEVIERDATSLWHRLHPQLQEQTRLDLSSVEDPSCRAVIGCFEQGSVDAAAWDITSDIGVPAFLCLVVDRRNETGHVGRGAGCHPSREIALLRALTEAAQVRTTYIVGSREDITPDDYAPSTLDARRVHARGLMRAMAQARRFGSIRSFGFDAFESEVAWLLQRLRSVGIRQVVAVDLSRAEFGVPVVRVVVPGLEGSDHHAGYTPGKRACAIAELRP